MAASSRFSHLERRPSGVFHWRRRWPRAARRHAATGNADAASSGKPFLCFSLRTDIPAEAKILARRLTALSDPVFSTAGMTMTIDRASAEAMLCDLVRFEIAAADQARAFAPYRPLAVAEAEARREAALQATLRQAIYLRDREIARRPLRAVAERLGVPLDEADPDWQWLAMEATRVLLDVSEERARRDRGEFDAPSAVFRSVMVQATATRNPSSGDRPGSAVFDAAHSPRVASPSFACTAEVPVQQQPVAAPALAAADLAGRTPDREPTDRELLDVTEN